MSEIMDQIKKAETMINSGDAMSGCKLGHEALKAMEAAFPASSPQVAEACFLLSQGEYALQNLDAAESLTRRALAIWEKDGESIGVSTCLNNLGRIYEERGQMDEGIGFHRRAADMRRDLLGVHPETAFSLGNLGTALAANSEWEEAARVLGECMDIYARVGVTSGMQLEGYKHNLEVCRHALADPEEEAFKQ